MSEDDRRRSTAFHESGHAMMAHWLGRQITIVSIRSTEHYGGITHHSQGPAVPYHERVLMMPTVLWPAPLRRRLETEILIALAGDIAAELAVVRPMGFRVPTEDEQRAEAIEEGLRRLSRGERDRLDAFEAATEPFEWDEESASRKSWAMDADAPGRHLAWLRDVARSIVYQPRFVRAVDALAAELLVSDAIGGRRARRIIEEALAHERLRSSQIAAHRRTGEEERDGSQNA